MTRRLSLALLLLLPALSGCVRTVGTIVTAPVRAASWGVDKATTSQREADRNSGRKMRKEQAKRDRESREQARKDRAARDSG